MVIEGAGQSHLLVARSHVLILQSMEPVTNHLESGLNTCNNKQTTNTSGILKVKPKERETDHVGYSVGMTSEDPHYPPGVSVNDVN